MSYDRNKVIALAESEVGYHEKGSNAYLDDKTANSGSGNWTKYARDLDALGDFYNGPKNGYPYCDVFYDWLLYKCFGKEAAMKLLCQPRYSAGAGCYYSAQYYKQYGQFYGPNTVPQPGDQIFFTYKAGEVSHTGIVVSVSGSTVNTIEGNTSDGTYRRSYQIGSGSIYGYGRPKWDDGGPTQTAQPETADQITALANEVIAGKWGIGADRVAKLTAAGHDYTAVQARVNEILSGKTTTTTPATPSVQTYTIGKNNEETIFNFCKEVLGLSLAAICGVLANIERESGFQTGAIGDAGTSYGICQWHASRNASLRSWCASNGKDYTALDGQLWYMKHELETTHAAVLTKMKSCANTEQGAEVAGYIWCSIFEVPADTIKTSEARGELARYTYWPKYNNGSAPAQEQEQAPAVATSGKTYQIALEELSEGMTGTKVERVQTLLIARGYTCGGRIVDGKENPDGDFGPTTKKAVEDFQTANGLKADGVVGADTMTALLK